MPKHYSTLSIVTHTLCAILVGVGLAYLSWGGVSSVIVKASNMTTDLVGSFASVGVFTYENKNNDKILAENTPISQVPTYIELDKIEIPTEGKFITADLGTMIITLYQDGQTVTTVPIETIGKEGAAWETPRGLYKVETKERNHFSSIGKVFMPYSMQFNGNYFIHGWTYYPDGTPVSAEFSGGCIKLKTVDAEKIFNFVSVGTPVYVFSDTSNVKNKDKNYISKSEVKVPEVSASSFLIADVNSGEVLIEKNRVAVLPSGQVSQLVSSLVTLDAINFFNQTKVKSGQITEFGSATLLLPGEKIVVKDLLYPMLFGDNGVAATTLAGVMGKETFVAKMNGRAKSIGLVQSTFTDPAGLIEGNLSSATDLFRLTRHTYIFKNYLFGITREKEKISGRHIWYNQNGLTGLDGFLGGFYGQTTSNKSAAVALFSIPNASTSTPIVVITVLDSNDAKADLALLADYARRGFSYNDEVEKNVEIVKPSAAVTSKISSNSTSTTLVFVGDIMLDRGVEKLILGSGGGDFNFPFLNLAKIKDADILFGNLEGPVSDQGRDLRNLYSFRMSPKVVPVLTTQGFDVLSVANNHAGDWTLSAFIDTFAKFKDSNISLIGGGLSRSEAIEPKIFEKNGIKFGYLGFSDVGPVGIKVASSTAGVLLASDPQAPEIIKQAAAKVDVLIVSYHFGNEYEKKSNWRQRELAHLAIDNGARVVVGHHPHVVQETENYRGGMIMYSLGNFIFDQYFSTDTMSGLAVKITFAGKNISKIQELKTVLNERYQVVVE